MGYNASTPSDKKQKLQVMIPLLIVIAITVLAHFIRTSFVPAFERVSSYYKLVKGSVEVGDELVLGKDDLNNTWQVLDIDDSEALLINKDYVRILSYDGLESHFCSHLGQGAHMTYPYIEDYEQKTEPASQWDESGIKIWLNDVYLPYEFNEKEQTLLCDHGYGDVFLLSLDEYHEFIEGDPDLKIYYPWWLRTSRRFNEGVFPDYVSHEGIIGKEPIEDGSDIAIRPAIRVSIGD